MGRIGSPSLKRFSLVKYMTLSVIVSLVVGLIIAIFSTETRSELTFWLLWVTVIAVLLGVIEYALIRKLVRRKKE
jgi:uncharacterized membrane protein YbhN (UPF0104 family)